MVCKRCGANIPIAENATEGKCKYCGMTQKVKTAEEENLDAQIFAKKQTLDEVSRKLKGKEDELVMIKKTLKLAITVVAVFLLFLLSWHLGAERSFKRNQVVLIFVSILVIPGFAGGYLGGIILAYYLAKRTSRSAHAALVLAICTFNGYSVYMAIHFFFTSHYKTVKQEIEGLSKIRNDILNDYNNLKEQLKALTASQNV